MRLCPKRKPSAYWPWVRLYPFETSLIVVTASQVLALLILHANGSELGGDGVPGWITLAVAAMFAVSTVLLLAGLLIGTAGFMATALRATLVTMATLIGMVLPGGITPAEIVVLLQVVPYLIIAFARSQYLEAAWETRERARARNGA